jgi:hypothetical protein
MSAMALGSSEPVETDDLAGRARPPEPASPLRELAPEDVANPHARYLAELFAALAADKALPKYQFERRVDAMLGIFLPDLLLKLYGWQAKIVVPEFPIKKPDNNQSTNVDYLMYRRSNACGSAEAWVFLELKTDDASFDREQFAIYLSAMRRGMPQLRSDLDDIVEATHASAKYDKLLRRLDAYPRDLPIELLYLRPDGPPIADCPDPVHFLSFQKLAGVDLERHAEVWGMFRRILLPAIQ